MWSYPYPPTTSLGDTPQKSSIHFSHRPDRPSLNKLRFDHRLAGVFFSFADIPDPAHDAVHHRAGATPTDMRDRWLALAERRIVAGDDQGKISRHPEASVEEEMQRCEIGGTGAEDDRRWWGDLKRRVKALIQTFEPPPANLVYCKS